MLLMSQTGGEIVVPFATMRRAEQTINGDWMVLDANGDVHQFSAGDWEIAMQETPRATLPAHPGTYLLHRNADGEEPPYYRSAVLGWVVGLDSVTRPVTVDVELQTMRKWVVRHPDGFIEGSTGDSWETTEHWLEATKTAA